LKHNSGSRKSSILPEKWKRNLFQKGELKMSGKKVIVIGAGAAGIYATQTLKAKGVDVLCLEANDAVGGRARAYSKDGYICETGALGTEPQWRFSRGLVNEMGFQDEYLFGKTMRVGFWRKKRLNLVGLGTFRQQLQWLPETLSFKGIPMKAGFQSIKVAQALMKEIKNISAKSTSPTENNFEDLLYLGNTSIKDYILFHGGKEALDYVFGPFMSLMVLGDTQDICISHMIALILTTLEGGKEAGGFVWMERGLGSFLQATYEKDRELYRLSTPVKKVVIENGKVKGVETKDGLIEADHVICATTATTALKIIPDLPETSRKPLETVRYSSTFNYMFGDRKKFTPSEFTMEFIPENQPRPLIKVMFDSAQRSKSYAPPGGTLLHAMTSYYYHDFLCQMSEEERQKMVISETQKMFPTMPDKPELIECARWDQAISLDAPKQIIALHYYEENHANDVRGLHLAGEYFYPIASTEGAMTSANRVVNRIMDQL
jgi:protoporphyrinogen oxidase